MSTVPAGITDIKRKQVWIHRTQNSWVKIKDIDPETGMVVFQMTKPFSFRRAPQQMTVERFVAKFRRQENTLKDHHIDPFMFGVYGFILFLVIAGIVEIMYDWEGRTIILKALPFVLLVILFPGWLSWVRSSKRKAKAARLNPTDSPEDTVSTEPTEPTTPAVPITPAAPLNQPLTPLPPVPSKERTADLLDHLSESVETTKAAGHFAVAESYQEMLDTATALAGHLDELRIQWGTRRRVGNSVVYSEHATEAIARDWVAAEPRRTLAIYAFGDWHLAPEPRVEPATPTHPLD